MRCGGDKDCGRALAVEHCDDGREYLERAGGNAFSHVAVATRVLYQVLFAALTMAEIVDMGWGPLMHCQCLSCRRGMRLRMFEDNLGKEPLARAASAASWTQTLVCAHTLLLAISYPGKYGSHIFY